MRQERKPSRPAPWKGIASKNSERGKKSQMMNFSLHLPTIFTFIRQHKATPKGKKDPYTSTSTALDICLVWTWTRLWICVAEGVLETQSMHIYIYTYIQGREVAKCCKHTLAAFSCGYDHSGVGHEVPPLPLRQSSSACWQLSVWLSLGCDSWWEKLCWDTYRSGVLYPSTPMSRSMNASGCLPWWNHGNVMIKLL